MEPLTPAARATAVRAGIASVAALALTVVHHVYGAIRYDTPWRLHVTHIAGLLALVLIATLVVYLRTPASLAGRWARGLFFAVAWLGPIAWIGLFEGGYNHALKLLAAGLSLPPAVFQHLYPPGLYEAPGDWIFEVTGVLQLVVAIVAIRAVVAFWRSSSPPLQGKT